MVKKRGEPAFTQWAQFFFLLLRAVGCFGIFVVLNKITTPKFIMGVLVKAKNGDEQFWNIEISCSQWEGSACTQSALIFLILSFVWAGGGFFSFFLCS
jgi:hypothetical protein